MLPLVNVIVTLCHLVTVGDNKISGCFEKVAARIEINPNMCGKLLPALARWKESGQYAGDEYWIGAARCQPGPPYSPKDWSQQSQGWGMAPSLLSSTAGVEPLAELLRVELSPVA